MEVLMWPISLGQAVVERLSLAVLKNKIDVSANLLAMINSSVDCDMFARIATLGRDETHQVIRDDELGGCYYVCFLLRGFHLISSIRLTVSGTARQLPRSGWETLDNTGVLAPGMIIVWETTGTVTPRKRIGFYVGDEEAVSTAINRGIPTRHHATFGDQHRIQRVYAHPVVHPHVMA